MTGRVLPIKQPEIKKYVEELTKGTMEYDKRFVYYLLAATGICVVPLTSFFYAAAWFPHDAPG